MKTKITALALITVTALSLAPKPAAASDKALAIAGGFIGGLIVASAINDSHHNDYPNGNTTIIVNEPAPRGFWREVSVEVWVPGCWIVERSFHGRSYRRYAEGHYERRNNRVWVSTGRSDHHDREISYGYGRGR